jgi:hypothetical protein
MLYLGIGNIRYPLNSMLELANHEGVHRFSLAILDELSKPKSQCLC